jgi:phospholipid/cholesterol/gamma-HCH transport system ATP-binding protein
MMADDVKTEQVKAGEAKTGAPSQSRDGTTERPVISLRGIVNRFGDQVVHDGVDLDVRRGEVMGIVGGSGSGKSVLMRTIIGLNQPAAGSIEVLGENLLELSESGRRRIEERWGVLFQNGALFSSLTVLENIEAPIKEHTDLSPALRSEIAELKTRLVGLSPDAGAKYPSELSGGMRKRAGLARALALDPEILFLDEPTAGLDPIGAAEFDQLIGTLQQSLGLTVVMVTHDLDSLVAICDRIAVLVDKRLKVGTLAELLLDEDPWTKAYFHGPRARAAGIDGAKPSAPAPAPSPASSAKAQQPTGAG